MYALNDHYCRLWLTLCILMDFPINIGYRSIWILSPLNNLKKTEKKTDQKWTPSDKTFWIRTCFNTNVIWFMSKSPIYFND